MYKAICKIIVVSLGLIYGSAVTGQQPAFYNNGKKGISLRQNPADNNVFISPGQENAKILPVAPTVLFSRYSSNLPWTTRVVNPVEKDQYIKDFGFFCRKEMQIEKSTGLPLRFRLGSLEQCNILEQKR